MLYFYKEGQLHLKLSPLNKEAQRHSPFSREHPIVPSTYRPYVLFAKTTHTDAMGLNELSLGRQHPHLASLSMPLRHREAAMRIIPSQVQIYSYSTFYWIWQGQNVVDLAENGRRLQLNGSSP